MQKDRRNERTGREGMRMRYRVAKDVVQKERKKNEN